MSIRRTTRSQRRRRSVRWSGGLLAAALVLAGCGPKPPAAPAPPKPVAKPSVSTNQTALATNTFLAEFVDDPKSTGKDPFFPRSTRRSPAIVVPTNTTTGATTPAPVRSAAVTNLVLKAILGTSTDRLVTINRTTLGVGEEGTVRFPGGKAVVKCLEIKERSVVILVDGERRELFFRESGQ